MQTLPLFLALSVGFTHAFETDHLVAVGSIVTRRNNLRLALKDGIFWGLGHTSTILLIGGVFLLGRFALNAALFHYLEAAVGAMLVVLGTTRLYRLSQHHKPDLPPDHSHPADAHAHKLAYGVGLVHGLAGSGALLLSMLTHLSGTLPSLLYLLLFGLGSIGGMMVAAGVFSVPFSARLAANPLVRTGLVVLSSGLCIGLGAKVLLDNLTT